MITTNVLASSQPDAVTLEALPDGLNRAVLCKNIEHVETEEGSCYKFDEADFYIPSGREETAESIAESFEAWWSYAAADHREPTVEERLAAVEEAVEALLM